MIQPTIVPDIKKQVIYGNGKPQPAFLFENERIKVVAGGLKAGQSIPEHPEALAVYYILEGKGQMVVDGERIAVGPGTTVVTAAGSRRGMVAETQLSFLATRIAP